MKIQRQEDTFALRLADLQPTTKVYRGLNIDTTLPGLEQVHAILHPPEQSDQNAHHAGWDHPAIGNHLLNWMENNRPDGGIGKHWSTNPAQSEKFAKWPNEETGRGGNLQAVIEGDWDGQGEDLGRTNTHEFDENGKRIRSFPEEQETTLSPGAKVHVKGLRIRPYDDNYWNGPDDGSPIDENHDGPWHQVLSEPSMRTAGRSQ